MKWCVVIEPLGEKSAVQVARSKADELRAQGFEILELLSADNGNVSMAYAKPTAPVNPDKSSTWLADCPEGELRRIEVGTLSRTRDRRSTCDAQRDQLADALSHLVDPPSFEDMLAEVARLVAAQVAALAE